MPAQRSLPAQPNLRYFKLEAKRRLRSGEFAVLHEAQRAIAREHGQPSWPAFCQCVNDKRGEESRVLPHLRWVLSRFRDAGEPGWASPADDELRQHFSDGFLAVIPAQELVKVIVSAAGELRQELIVGAQTALTAQCRLGGLELHASAEAEPPHRLIELYSFPLGERISDSRIAAPEARVRGEVPAAAAEIIDQAVAVLGLAGLVMAGQAQDHSAPVWTAAAGWADLDRSEPMTAGHRFPVHAISTLITAVAVLRLVADGRIGLDDPANTHLRTVTLADATVTIRELLAHTGGVASPRELFAEHAPGLAELCGPVLACGEGRGSFRFSGGGYAALGQLLADVTGLAYADAAARLVLDPLGMTASSFPASVADIAAAAVTSYNVTLDRGLAPEPASVCALPAAGGLWTTAPDLVRFGAGWSSLLPDWLAREALRPHARRGPGWGTMALGWLIALDGTCTGIVGMSLGTTSSLLVRRADNQVQVALTNRAVSLEPLNKQVLDVMLPAALLAFGGDPLMEGAACAGHDGRHAQVGQHRRGGPHLRAPPDRVLPGPGDDPVHGRNVGLGQLLRDVLVQPALQPHCTGCLERLDD
jgi:CubicO group peptidase (beta-lactamase class C family)